MTSDERREVAAKLRADHRQDHESQITFIARMVTGKDRVTVVDVLRLPETLADLIDPTCHIVLKPSDSDFSDEPQYLCSRCGKAGIDVYERDDYTLAGIVDCANHCSYCGARVVRGDE